MGGYNSSYEPSFVFLTSVKDANEGYQITIFTNLGLSSSALKKLIEQAVKNCVDTFLDKYREIKF